MGRKTTFIIAAMLYFTVQAAADETRTEQLVWECKGQQPVAEPELGIIHCTGYVAGMLDMHAIMADGRVAGGSPQFCFRQPAFPTIRPSRSF
jgi:hypothetical protein